MNDELPYGWTVDSEFSPTSATESYEFQRDKYANGFILRSRSDTSFSWTVFAGKTIFATGSSVNRFSAMMAVENAVRRITEGDMA